ncbi:MAG: hypothetical protein HYV07_05270 [Deltaproteobacteria bacterium]|nr:hypothetical protein [Deltaproteobacteria bacterium]
MRPSIRLLSAASLLGLLIQPLGCTDDTGQAGNLNPPGNNANTGNNNTGNNNTGNNNTGNNSNVDLTKDDDNDGVPNVQEDRNQNGTIDPGETNPASTDTDGDGIPDEKEVSTLACGVGQDRPFEVYDAPGADSMILVDRAISEHSMLRTPDGKAPGLMVADPGLNVAAAMVAKRPSAGVNSPSAQRDAERRTSLASIGSIDNQATRAFTTAEGFSAEQAVYRIRSGGETDARTVASQLASAFLGGAQLTGTLAAGGPRGRDVTVNLLTIQRSSSQFVLVAAVGVGALTDGQSIRLEELTDGTNVARHGSYTVHACDGFKNDGGGAVDMIFVVDDSGSMEDDQQALADAGNAMTDILTAAQVDYRLAVARTFATGPESDPRRGRLEGNGLTRDLQEFRNTIVVGADGGWEPGLEVGLLAYDQLLPKTAAGAPLERNRLREGAGVVVVQLSDERDQYVECAACGDCRSEESQQTFCTDPAGQTVVERYVREYNSRDIVLFAIVGDLPNGCQQTSTRDDFEPGQGHVEVANATGGRFGSLCGNMRQNLEDVARLATGVASSYKLTYIPASASIKVVVGLPGQGHEVGRSRENGWDFDPVQNTIIFYGNARPVENQEVVIGYRRWEWKDTTLPGGGPGGVDGPSPIGPPDSPTDPNNPPVVTGRPYDPTVTPGGDPSQTEPDPCMQCEAYQSCLPEGDTSMCAVICGDDICMASQVCLPEYARCGDPSELPNSPNPGSACGSQTCDSGRICDPSRGVCVIPCETSGCNTGQVCNTTTHVCQIPDF